LPRLRPQDFLPLAEQKSRLAATSTTRSHLLATLSSLGQEQLKLSSLLVAAAGETKVFLALAAAGEGQVA